MYVEVLKGLEDILAAESGPVAAEGSDAVDARVKAMDDFLRLVKHVISGGVILDGHYPVPERSHGYRFPTTFPRVHHALQQETGNYTGQDGVRWFKRHKVLLYYIYRPRGWTWNTAPSSSGSENEGNDEGDIWDISDAESGSVKSDFTSGS